MADLELGSIGSPQSEAPEIEVVSGDQPQDDDQGAFHKLKDCLRKVVVGGRITAFVFHQSRLAVLSGTTIQGDGGCRS